MKIFNCIFIICVVVVVSLLSYFNKSVSYVVLLSLVGLFLININTIMNVLRTFKISKDGIELQSNSTQGTEVSKLTTISDNPLKQKMVIKMKESSLSKLPKLQDNDYKNVIVDEENVILKELKSYKEPKAVLIRALASKNLEILGERIYKTIYKSQILLLKSAQEKGFVSIKTINRFYNNAKASYKTIYENYSVEQWLNYCTSAFKLLIKNKNNYVLSDLGKAFLFYIYNQGYDINNKIG